MLFKADEIIIEIMERKMTEKIKNAMPLAISIGLLPPLWAVVSSWVGIEFGWVALACGGIYVAAGDDVKNRTRNIIRVFTGMYLGIYS